jgi:hypothetical protein
MERTCLNSYSPQVEGCMKNQGDEGKKKVPTKYSMGLLNHMLICIPNTRYVTITPHLDCYFFPKKHKKTNIFLPYCPFMPLLDSPFDTLYCFFFQFSSYFLHNLTIFFFQFFSAKTQRLN